MLIYSGLAVEFIISFGPVKQLYETCVIACDATVTSCLQCFEWMVLQMFPSSHLHIAKVFTS